MSSWMISVSELLLLARALNATLVEPCLKKGRLVPCSDANKTLAFRDVFDLERIREGFHPHIMVSHEEFVQQTTHPTMKKDHATTAVHYYKTCLQTKTGKPHHTVACGNLTTRHLESHNPELEAAIQNSIQGSGISVLNITFYRRNALRELRLADSSNESKKVISSNKEVLRVRSNHLHFRQEHHDYVDGLLKRANVQDFSVLHWRAEMPHIPYLDCAEHIVRARNAMWSSSSLSRQQQQQKMPFVLLSSLNTREEYMWSIARKYALNSTAHAALELLLNQQGFLKLDAWIQEEDVADSGLLAVWDLILVTKAKEFATCTPGCGGICDRCNFLGRFAELAVELRRNSNLSSHECWPV